jgi:hypothetical protein
MPSMGLHNVGGRMGEFRLLYLLCMLHFPVPLHSLHAQARATGCASLCSGAHRKGGTTVVEPKPLIEL